MKQNKKAIEIAWTKLIVMLITIITILVLSSGLFQTTNFYNSEEFLLRQAQFKYNCDLSNVDCEKIVRDCDKYSISEVEIDDELKCDSKEQEHWDAFKSLEIECWNRDKCNEEEFLAWDEYTKEFVYNQDSFQDLEYNNDQILENIPQPTYESTTGELKLNLNLNSDVKYTIDNLKKIQNVEGSLNGYDYVIKKSKEYGINPYLSLTIITIESKGKNVENSIGAVGIMQLMPCTAYGLGLKPSSNTYKISSGRCENIKGAIPNKNTDERYIISKNIDAGIKYLNQLSKSQLTQNDKDVAAAYNAGLDALRDSVDCSNLKRYECEINGEGYKETRNYVVKYDTYSSSIIVS